MNDVADLTVVEGCDAVQRVDVGLGVDEQDELPCGGRSPGLGGRNRTPRFVPDDGPGESSCGR